MKTRKILSYIICISSLVLSAILLKWTWQILSERYQNEIKNQALRILSEFDPIAIAGINQGDKTESDPEYLQIRDQLNFIEAIYPNVAHSYLLKQDTNGLVYLFMESASSTTSVGSGQNGIGDDTSVDLQRVFETGDAVLVGPINDEGGEWVTAFMPIADPYSGEIVAFLRLDMDATDWADARIMEFNLPLWAAIILNLSILGLMAFLIYIKKTSEQPKMETLARNYMIVFTGLIGACITILSVWYISFYERDSRQQIFQQLSKEKIHNIALQMKDIDRFSLRGLEEFFLGSDYVSKEEFSQYSQALLENELVSGWVWIPKIPREARAEFETELDEGSSTNHGIWEYDSEGNEQPAGIADEYYPIEYITPENAFNLSLLGFNMATCTHDGINLEESLQEGLTIASIPVSAFCNYSGEYVLVLRPVWEPDLSKEQVGFVAAFIQVEKLIQVTQIDQGAETTPVFLDFFQFSPEGDVYLLVSNSPEEMLQEHLDSKLRSHSNVEFTVVEPVFAYGNTYAIATHPSPNFARLYPAISGIILAFSGGLLTIALMFFVSETSGRNVILSHLVSQRTKDLSESEERLRLASTSVKLGIYDINTLDGKVIVNDLYAEMLGYDPSTFFESYETWQSRLHPKDRQKTKEIFDQFQNGEIAEYKVEFRMKTASEDWIWVFSTAMVVERDENDRPLRILGSHLDITTRKKTTEKIKDLLDQSNRQLKRMATLREIDKAITSDYDLDQILKLFLQEVRRQLDIDVALIFLVDKNAGGYRYAAGSGLEQVSIEHLTLSQNNSLAGKAANYGRPIHTQALEEFVEPSFLPILEKEGIKDCFAFSLVTQGKVKGAIELWHRTIKIPTSEWMRYAETLAGQAAIAIEYSQLLSGLRSANEELKSAYDATIEGWSHAMDLKDKETEGHTQRVTKMTVELAKRIGINGEALDHIRRGALLHDIGKMGIPDSILLKPDLLTDEEWVEMKKHPKYAFEMLNSIEYLRPALDIPYLHHEKWDGSGYPLGLKGEDIPISARLFAFIDVFDALTNDRPYRPAWSVQEAIAFIEENSGIHFDPNITPIFISMIRDEMDS
jgi:PAS domain S-box-containing protein/putative nucleotidyltransferase with HDIG domain